MKSHEMSSRNISVVYVLPWHGSYVVCFEDNSETTTVERRYSVLERYRPRSHLLRHILDDGRGCGKVKLRL